MNKPRIALLCGGQSSEHEVSLRSGLSVMQHLPQDKYELLAVGISKDGRWLMGDPLIHNPGSHYEIRLADGLQEVTMQGGCIAGKKIDCVFSVLHGTFGEDGAMQGFLEMQHVPYVGSGPGGSHLAMDKDVMKRMLKTAGLPTVDHITLYQLDARRPSYAEAVAQLGPILFVKPSSQGSSVGISKVKGAADYGPAVAKAFQFDEKVIVESAIAGRELELAILGDEELIASWPGEVIPDQEFYSYEAKYVTNGTRLEIKADLSPAKAAEMQELAKRIFRLLGLSGFARMDFFLDAQGKFWFNEPNTLPGFTSISMYPKMMAAAGVEYPDLIHRLIQLGMRRHQRNQQFRPA